MTDKSQSNPSIPLAPEKSSRAISAPRAGLRPIKHKLNLVHLLQALRRKWFLAGIVGILLATLTGVALWFMVPLAHPMVFARLKILEKGGGNWMEHPDPPLQRQTLTTLIKDLLTLTTAVRRPEVAQLSVIKEQAEPEEWLQKELRVDFPSGPEILQISMTGDRPQELKIIVNAVREVYLQQYVDDMQNERQLRLKRLMEYDERAKADIENVRGKLRNKAESGREIDKETIVLKQKIAAELLEMTRKEIIKTRSELRQLNTELKLRTETNAQSIDTNSKLFGELLDQHPQLEPLMRERARIQDLLDQTKKAAPTNPRVAKYEADLAENQKQIDQKKADLRPQLLAGVKNKLQTDREVDLDNLKYKIREREDFEKTLNESANNLVKESTDLSKNTVNVEEERQQLALWESVRSRLAGTIEGLRAEANAPGRIRPLGEPASSYIDKYSNKIRMATLGSFAAFMLGLFIVAFIESRTRRIDSTEDVLDHFGMTVVGKVPAPPKRIRLGFAGAEKEEDEEAWHAVLTESVDSFRTQLLHTVRKNSQQILMVCSADSGEGKTSLACHLALSLARSGLKTLLIDADLRNPTAHELFELPVEPGLSEIIRDQSSVTQAVVRTSAPGLWLLPAGVCNTRVIELLAQEALKPIFSELRQEFDFIVVDTSPILPVADPLLIAQHTDAVIFSLMHQVSRVSSTRDALERLHALNIDTLGAVMNGTKPYRGYNQRKYAYRTLNT